MKYDERFKKRIYDIHYMYLHFQKRIWYRNEEAYFNYIDKDETSYRE